MFNYCNHNCIYILKIKELNLNVLWRSGKNKRHKFCRVRGNGSRGIPRTEAAQRRLLGRRLCSTTQRLRLGSRRPE